MNFKSSLALTVIALIIVSILFSVPQYLLQSSMDLSPSSEPAAVLLPFKTLFLWIK